MDMEKKKMITNVEPKKNTAQKFLKEWKRKKSEDEKEFLQEINNPQHKKKMEKLSGKIVKNGVITA